MNEHFATPNSGQLVVNISMDVALVLSEQVEMQSLHMKNEYEKFKCTYLPYKS